MKTPLLDTEGGRSVLDYTVRCALTPDQVVYGPDGEAFYGAFGFSPAWTERALDIAEQRWVSACLLARTNALGETVAIELVASHPVIDPWEGPADSRGPIPTGPSSGRSCHLLSTR